jgi:hypothetical protein
MNDDSPRQIFFCGTHSWRSAYIVFWGAVVLLLTAVPVRLLVANIALTAKDFSWLRVLTLVILAGFSLLFGAILAVISYRVIVGRVDKQVIDQWGINGMVGMYQARIPWEDVDVVATKQRLWRKRYDVYLTWRAWGGNSVSGLLRTDAGLTREECHGLIRRIENDAECAPECIAP